MKKMMNSTNIGSHVTRSCGQKLSSLGSRSYEILALSSWARVFASMRP